MRRVTPRNARRSSGLNEDGNRSPRFLVGTGRGRLEAAAVSQTDAARVLGHTMAGMSYGVYSSGPGLKRLAAVVEAIEYEGFSPAVPQD